MKRTFKFIRGVVVYTLATYGSVMLAKQLVENNKLMHNAR